MIFRKKEEWPMKLGAFYVSLNVKDILESKKFYEAIGFKVFKGNISENWLIMKNDNTMMGLFQGMFHRNTMTFHPGWDSDAKKLDDFINIKKLRKIFKKRGLKIIFDAGTFDPASKTIIISDPDGNPILFEQFV